MTAIKKAFAAVLKDIGIALHIIDIGPVSGLFKKYSTIKANYFYSKAGEDVEEWLVEIDQIIEANNVTTGKRVAVAATHLRDTVAD